jgi:predicted Zn-dependent protease
MQAVFHDGRTARAHTVEIAVEDEVLVFQTDDGEQRWPLTTVRPEIIHERVRVAPAGTGAARLTLALEDWRALTRDAQAHHRAQRRRHVGLVAGLAAVALTVAGAVFVGIPAASGPLAQATPPALERQIGDNLDSQVSVAFRPCGGAVGQRALDRFGQQLARASGTPFDVRVRAVHAPMVNAWAMPGGAIMVTDQLIALAASPDELSAVVAHEAAHVQRRHVMQAVWRSFGFGVILDAVVGGGTGAGQQAVLLMGSFTSLRYGRADEAQADSVGQDLLVSQGLSSAGMASFFQRLAATSEGKDAEAVKELISDHPDIVRRAQASRARARPGGAAFTPAEWIAIKSACQDGYSPLKRLKKLF